MKDKDIRLRVGNEIREARKAKRMPQWELGEEVGLEQAYICRIENGTANVKLEQLEAICKVLDITITV